MKFHPELFYFLFFKFFPPVVKIVPATCSINLLISTWTADRLRRHGGWERIWRNKFEKYIQFPNRSRSTKNYWFLYTIISVLLYVGQLFFFSFFFLYIHHKKKKTNAFINCLPQWLSDYTNLSHIFFVSYELDQFAICNLIIFFTTWFLYLKI